MAEDRIQIDAVAQSRYQEGHRIGTIANRRDVFLPHHMKGVRVEQSPIRRYSDYWLGWHTVVSGFAKQQGKPVGVPGHCFSADFKTQLVIGPVVQVREIDEYETGVC